MIEVKYKECGECKESKPLYEFTRIPRARDGLSTKCTECIKKLKKTPEIQKIRKRFPEKMQFNPYPAFSARGSWWK